MIQGWINQRNHRYGGPTISYTQVFDCAGVSIPEPALFKGQQCMVTTTPPHGFINKNNTKSYRMWKDIQYRSSSTHTPLSLFQYFLLKYQIISKHLSQCLSLPLCLSLSLPPPLPPFLTLSLSLSMTSLPLFFWCPTHILLLDKPSLISSIPESCHFSFKLVKRTLLPPSDKIKVQGGL